uniref:BTB domain-containing protein n=1 Tax=Timema bartmani TaxID=61472 RepID=A0A7R9EY68_9NEOP|nr:unnamed protein product [Timema bartmani]
MSSVYFKWDTHADLLRSLERLLQTECMVDVTIAVEGQLLKAHKLVLCACSQYFHTMLSSIPATHPIIFMRDVKLVEMKALLSFMYRGEACVSQEEVEGVLRTADALGISGLTHISWADTAEYIQVDETSQCDESDFVTFVIGGEVGEKEKKDEPMRELETSSLHNKAGSVAVHNTIQDANCKSSHDSSQVIDETTPQINLPTTSVRSTIELVPLLHLRVVPEMYLLEKEGYLQFLVQALDLISAGQMGIKPAARAFSIPVATLHHATRRRNITSPMQQGGYHSSAHKSQERGATRLAVGSDSVTPGTAQHSHDHIGHTLPEGMLDTGL